jgi:hypothetical protein
MRLFSHPCLIKEEPCIMAHLIAWTFVQSVNNVTINMLKCSIESLVRRKYARPSSSVELAVPFLVIIPIYPF